MSDKTSPELDIYTPEYSDLSMRPAVVGTLWVINESWDDDYDWDWRDEEEERPNDIAVRKVEESDLTVTEVAEMIHFEGHSGMPLDEAVKRILASWKDVDRVAHISAYEYIPEDRCLSLSEYGISNTGAIRKKEVHYLDWTKENVIEAGFIRDSDFIYLVPPDRNREAFRKWLENIGTDMKKANAVLDTPEAFEAFCGSLGDTIFLADDRFGHSWETPASEIDWGAYIRDISSMKKEKDEREEEKQ